MIVLAIDVNCLVIDVRCRRQKREARKRAILGSKMIRPYRGGEEGAERKGGTKEEAAEVRVDKYRMNSGDGGSPFLRRKSIVGNKYPSF
jgi:hypothetical protein